MAEADHRAGAISNRDAVGAVKPWFNRSKGAVAVKAVSSRNRSPSLAVTGAAAAGAANSHRLIRAEAVATRRPLASRAFSRLPAAVAAPSNMAAEMGAEAAAVKALRSCNRSLAGPYPTRLAQADSRKILPCHQAVDVTICC